MNIGYFVKKNAGTILTVLGSIGVVGTAATAIHDRDTYLTSIFWAEDALNSGKTVHDETLKPKDKLPIVLKSFIPTAVVGGATIGCIVGSNAVNKKEIAGLATTCAILGKRYASYRKAVIDRHGEEEDKEIQAELVKTCANYHCVCPDVPDEKYWWKDPHTGKKFQRYERDIIDAELHLNRNFALRGYCSVNEFREFLGLDPIPKGEDYGWSMEEGYCFIDFEHRMNDDGLCEIVSVFAPDPDYLRGWMYD